MNGAVSAAAASTTTTATLNGKPIMVTSAARSLLLAAGGKPNITVSSATISRTDLALGGGNINIKNPLALKVSSSSGSMTGSLSPSPNVSVTSTGKRVAGGGGSRGNNSNNSNNSSSAVVNNRSKESAAQQQQKNNNKDQVNSTTKGGNKDFREINLKGDIRNIMHAFGDGTSPLEDSVQLMEVIIRQEMMAFLFICDTAAYWGGAKVLGLKECIYALRNDKAFLSRLFKHLIFKDQQHRALRAQSQGQQQQQTNNSTTITKVIPGLRNYYAEIRTILEELDGSGEMERLLDFDNNHYLDTDKSDKEKGGGGGGGSSGSIAGAGGTQSQGQVGGGDRDRDREINVRRLISPKYVNYAKARSVSFARKLPQLQEWVSIYLHSDFKLNQSFMEILAFLVYEIVAQIVDLSFIVKRERNSGVNSSLKFSDPRGSNPETCMSASVLRKDEECNNVSEMLVLASELEAKRLKKVSPTASNRETLITKSVHCLSPSEIREAYSRMQNTSPPSASFRGRAEKIKQFNFQY